MSQRAGSRFTIGRERSCDIAIADESVSRLHAELTILENGKLFLTDCHSSNGTAVVRDGAARRISQEFVLATDRVQFGDVVLNMADVLESVRGRVKQAAVPAAAAPRDAPLGDRVERCRCGAIKPQGKPCPACGA